MQTLLGCPLRFALVRARAVPEPRAMSLMKLQSGTLTPILSNPGFKDRSRALDSPVIFKHIKIHFPLHMNSHAKTCVTYKPRFSTTVTGPGKRESSRP